MSPEVTKWGQVFYRKEADATHGRCRCPDDSGSCDWCQVFYNGLDEEEEES